MAEKVNPEVVNDEELQNEIDIEEDIDTGEDDDLDESTAAADTLKPGAGSGGAESKSVTLATFTSLLAKLGKDDLSKLFTDTQAVFGKGKAPGAVDKAAANRSTVAMKPSHAMGSGAWKEDIDDMFAGEELTEELREKASVVFEAAVNTRMTLETVRLEEEFAAKEAELQEAFDTALEEETTVVFEAVTEKLDQYLDYVVEQWMEENQVALDNTLRTDIAENFIQGLHNLFSENYIRVPDEKIDIVAELKSELDEARTALNTTLDEKLELEAIINEATKEATLEEVSEGLAETQIEKLRVLSEGIEYTTPESYRKKLDILKESTFKTKAKVDTGLITEAIDGTDTTENTQHIPAQMDIYAKAIKKAVN